MGTLSFAAVGDIMLGDHPVCFGHGIRSAIRERGFAYMIADCAESMRKHDVVLGNLECVLSDVGADDGNIAKAELRGDKAAVGLLNDCGVNVVSVANNHMLQHGPEAFEDSAAWLRRHHIAPVGIYENQDSNVVEMEQNGERIAIVAYSLRPEHFCKDNKYYAHGPIERIYEQVAALSKASPGRALIVSLHWGEEYLHVPSARQIEVAHRLIDSGAAVIVGHHPHVLQGVEEYRGGLIAYSLGNFIFDSWQLPTRESAILSCQFQDGSLRSYSLEPLFIDANYVVRRESGRRKDAIAAKIARYSQAIKERKDLAAVPEVSYERIAAKKYLRYRLECYWYFVSHFWRYEPRVLYASLFRSVLRRFGLA